MTSLDDTTLLAAARILLAAGPQSIRQMQSQGWTADRLLTERRSLVSEAVARSGTLRRAALDHTDHSLVDDDAPASQRDGTEATTSPPKAVDAQSPISESAASRREHDDGELHELRQRVQTLTADIDALRAEIPTRRERARQNRLRGQLRRSENRLGQLENTVDQLKNDNAALAEQLDAVRLERDDALEERDLARRSRATLEERLGDVTARADYLRHLLPAEVERLTAQTSALPDGKNKTRARNHAGAVEALLTAIDNAYPSLGSLNATDLATADESMTGAPTPVGTEPPVRSEVASRQDAPVRVGPTRGWDVLPLGGADEIGGSALLVTVADRRILIDAGIRPNGRSRAEMVPRRVGEIGDRLDAIVVTHAHADHAAYVPALTDRFRTTPIVCSPGTAALLPTMWRDSLNVMTNRAELEAEWMPQGAPAPLYSDADLVVAEDNRKVLEFGRVLRIGSLDMRLFPAGHVLGAAGVVLSAEEGRGGRVVITGDISDVRQASVSECELPDPALVRDADLLVIESTYCHEALPRREDQVDQLVAAVREVIARRGRVLIPAFALGRAQEIALILSEQLPDVPVLVDGLARDVSRIYEGCGADEATRINASRRQQHEQLREQSSLDDIVPPVDVAEPIRIFTDMVQEVPDRGRLRAMRSFQRGVIITTSGMLTGGRAVQWAKEILPNPNDALFLCGYQDEEAPGRRLTELMDQPERAREPLTLFDQRAGPVQVPVCATIRNYRLSAHADQRGLIDVIDEVAARRVMLVHGVRRNQQHFREVLRVRGRETTRTGDLHFGPS